MSKNVTGGIILLLAGSAAIALAATNKGQNILAILTNGQALTLNSAPSSVNNPGFNSGFGGFDDSSSEGSGTGGGGSAAGGGGKSGITSVASYKNMFGHVGERAASVVV